MSKNINRKKLLSVLLSFVLLFTVASVSQAASFSDVSKSYTFYKEVNYLVDNGIIQGYSNGTFKPNQAVTRGEAAIMIGRALDLDGTKRKTSFSDVDKNNIASGFIQSAADKGIIQGYKDGTFRPNENVSRGQMAIFLSRAFNLEDSQNVKFKDVSSNMVAYPYIEKLIAAGITNGYQDGTFKPYQSVTRGQFSAFMARALNPSFKLSGFTYTTYKNSRFGFSVMVPTTFKAGGVPSNNDGRTFYGGNCVINVYGSHMGVLDPNETIHTYYNQALYDALGSDILYQNVSQNTYAVLYEIGNDIVYQKGIANDGCIFTLNITYPSDQKDTYDVMRKEISNSFKPGRSD